MLTINWKQKFKENIVEIERAVREIWQAIYSNKEEGGHLTLYLWYDNNLTFDHLAGNRASSLGIAIVIYSLEYDPDKKVEDFCFEKEMEDTFLFLNELEQENLKFRKMVQDKKNATDTDYSEAKEKLRNALEENTHFWYITFFENDDDWDFDYSEGFSLIDELYCCSDVVPEKELGLALEQLNNFSKCNNQIARVKLQKGCTYSELMALLDAHLEEVVLKERKSANWSYIRFNFA